MADSTIVGAPGATGYPDNTNPAVRSDRLGAIMVAQLGAGQEEQVKRGNGFTLTITNTTSVAAGNVTAASAAASTNFAIWNPLGSNKVLVLRKFYLGIVSGTIVGGPVLFNQFTGALPTIASVGTAYNRAIQPTVGGPVAKFVASAAGSTLTGGSALVAMGPGSITYSAGTYAALAGAPAVEDLNGRFVILPGGGFVPCVAAAGTSVLAQWGLDWDEVPL